VGRDADIVVVGAGVAGVATARALARSGRGVLLLEQFALGHDRGSSHGGSRIFRLSYPDAHYVRLAQGSLEGWRELEAECGEALIVSTGTLDFGPGRSENARALSSCGARYELLSGAEATARFGLMASPDEPALFQPEGGTILADRANAAFTAAAREANAEIAEGTRVTGLALERGGVRVSTGSDEIVAGAVVVTAGAWAAPLLARVGIELAVIPTRETVTYFDVPHASELPSVMDEAVPAAAGYGLARPGQVTYALAAPGIGLKAGLHHAGPATSPNEPGTPDEGVVRWASDWVTSRYPGARPSATAPETCLYTNTADESFVLERHGRIVVGSACSGHAFKFAPALGRTLAALARDAAG
jgi:sarcosine oxidase